MERPNPEHPTLDRIRSLTAFLLHPGMHETEIHRAENYTPSIKPEEVVYEEYWKSIPDVSDRGLTPGTTSVNIDTLKSQQ